MKEELYQDFVSNVLPQLQEGLTITYEYFVDLFGRYIHYLLISDILTGIFLVLSFSIMWFFLVKNIKWLKRIEYYNGEEILPGVLCFALSLGMLSAGILFFDTIDNIVKDLYIPEVRVYEEIQYMRNSTNN